MNGVRVAAHESVHAEKYPLQIVEDVTFDTEALLEIGASFKPMPHCMVLGFHESKEMNGLILSDRKSGRQSDVKMLIAKHPDIDIPIGSLCLIRHFIGRTIQLQQWKGKRYDNVFLTFAGRAISQSGEPFIVPVDESVPAYMTDFDKFDIVANGRKVIVDRGPLHETSVGGLHLPDNVKDRNGMGVIVDAGPEALALGLEVGQMVLYSPSAVRPFKWLGVKDKSKMNYAIMDAANILAVVDDNE